jgi:hypothetical protein
MMTQLKGTFLECVQKAVAMYRLRTEQDGKHRAFHCQIKGPLLTSLYLTPGETEDMTLNRLGEAISNQARISQAPVGDQPAFLEYDKAWIGEDTDDYQVFGKLYLVGVSEPVVLIYRLEAGKEAEAGLSSETLT